MPPTGKGGVVTRQPAPPATYLAEGSTWPDGPFHPDAPVLTAATARYTQAVRAEWSGDTGASPGWHAKQL